MSKTISQLAAAPLPIQESDQIVISRDGNVLLKTSFADLPLSNAAVTALSEILLRVLTNPQQVAGASGTVGLTSTGEALGLDGFPLRPFTSIDAVSAPVTFTQNDNNKIFDNTTATQFTIPTGLVEFTCIILPPDSGTVTITAATGVTINNTLNGSVTRSSANTAVQIIPTSVSNSYRITGI